MFNKVNEYIEMLKNYKLYKLHNKDNLLSNKQCKCTVGLKLHYIHGDLLSYIHNINCQLLENNTNINSEQVELLKIITSLLNCILYQYECEINELHLLTENIEYKEIDNLKILFNTDKHKIINSYNQDNIINIKEQDFFNKHNINLIDDGYLDDTEQDYQDEQCDQDDQDDQDDQYDQDDQDDQDDQTNIPNGLLLNTGNIGNTGKLGIGDNSVNKVKNIKKIKINNLNTVNNNIIECDDDKLRKYLLNNVFCIKNSIDENSVIQNVIWYNNTKTIYYIYLNGVKKILHLSYDNIDWLKNQPNIENKLCNICANEDSTYYIHKLVNNVNLLKVN